MSELRDLEVGRGIVLPRRLLSERFARAGGRGGQNVNKVETKVDLRLDLDAAAAWLGPVRTARVRERLASRLDAAGRVHLTCDAHRTRARNRETAVARLEALVAEALVPPRARRATRPTRGSKEKRLATKRRRAALKRGRSRRDDD